MRNNNSSNNAQHNEWGFMIANNTKCLVLLIFILLTLQLKDKSLNAGIQSSRCGVNTQKDKKCH